MLAHPAFALDWNLVRTFVAVARNGSLAAGARALGITHPTAARHIQLLEEGLGTTLFTRSGRGLVLNDMGEALQAAAVDMHASAMAFQNRIETLQATPVRSVRLGVAEILAEMLPDLMLAELDTDGDTTPMVDMLVSDDVLNLLQRDADMAVRHERPEQQELLCKRVGVVKMGAYASCDYVQRYGLLTFDNIGGHRFVDGLRRQYVQQRASLRGVPVASEQIVFRSDSLACQRAAVRAGWGIALMPTWMAAQEDNWTPVFDVEQIVDIEVWLIARPEVRDNKPLKELFTNLGQALQAQLNQVGNLTPTPTPALA